MRTPFSGCISGVLLEKTGEKILFAMGKGSEPNFQANVAVARSQMSATPGPQLLFAPALSPGRTSSYFRLARRCSPRNEGGTRKNVRGASTVATKSK